ncbi:hypothetical protein I3843_14G108800 [Carya illinoinensis]|nr:hypothetical protein I3843_14G108800 [Carya illinoinensis]
MEVVPVENDESKNFKTLLSFYSSYLWKRVVGFLPTSASSFLGKISSLCRQAARARFRRRRECLPLPLPSDSLDSYMVLRKPSRVYDVLEDILKHALFNLHNIQENLQFWQSRAEGSNARKMYFMIFERGPRAFIQGTVKLIRVCVAEGSSMQHLCHSAASHISERIKVLSCLQSELAIFLAKIYMEVDRFGEELVKDPETSLPALLATINGLFSNLEASIGHLHATCQRDAPVEGGYSGLLKFEKLPGVSQEGSQWTDCEVGDAINLIYQNIHKLDSYLSDLVARHRKPRKITLHWVGYTCGAVGLSICSLWVLQHSSLMGSPDIDNWIREARDSTISFFKDHELLEIVMERYEKELTHPIQNLLNGELARALLIQVQKLKLDIETAMLELDQILKANEINFAVLAALPAFFLSLILLMLVRAWFKRDTRAEGRGRMARLQRRLLIVEVERRIMQYQTFVDQKQEKDAQCMFGLVLYSLHRLYHAVEGHAKATGEWQCLRQDIIDLGKPGLQTTYKLLVTSRMERIYDCLLPALKR